MLQADHFEDERGFQSLTFDDLLIRGVSYSLSSSLPSKELKSEDYWEFADLPQILRKGFIFEGPRNDFGEWNNPNLGWKLHLKVEVGHVKNMIRFLRDNGFHFKYLNGGTPEDGKVFTVYCGSYDMASKNAQFLSDRMLPFLLKPTAADEYEFSPGVVGRFDAVAGKPVDGDYTRYGLLGIPVLRQYYAPVTDWLLSGRQMSRLPKDQAIASFRRLSSDFGSYFSG